MINMEIFALTKNTIFVVRFKELIIKKTVREFGEDCHLGSFLFEIASPGIRHPGLPIIDSQSQNYEYSGLTTPNASPIETHV